MLAKVGWRGFLVVVGTLLVGVVLLIGNEADKATRVNDRPTHTLVFPVLSDDENDRQRRDLWLIPAEYDNQPCEGSETKPSTETASSTEAKPSSSTSYTVFEPDKPLPYPNKVVWPDLLSEDKNLTETLPPKSGRGVLLIFFSPELTPPSADEGIESAARTAASYRRQNPKLPIALLTTHNCTSPQCHNATQSVFTHIVPFPASFVSLSLTLPCTTSHCQGAQRSPVVSWLTRTWAVTLSPFVYTLAVDMDTFNCASLDPLFDSLEDSNVDMATSTHGNTNRVMLPDNGVMYFRWGPRFEALWRAWAMEHARMGAPTSDQEPLLTILLDRGVDGVERSASGDGLGGAVWAQLSPRFSVRMFPVRATKGLIGEVAIVHAGDVVERGDGYCAVYNRHVGRRFFAVRPGVAVDRKEKVHDVMQFLIPENVSECGEGIADFCGDVGRGILNDAFEGVFRLPA